MVQVPRFTVHGPPSSITSQVPGDPGPMIVPNYAEGAPGPSLLGTGDNDTIGST